MAEFIVFEGLDGTGKTTQIQLLKEYLENQDIPVFATAEPTDSETGRLLRKMLSGEFEASACQSAALFLADRLGHCNEIKKHLDRGETVLCDRYYYSTLAYQGLAADFEWVKCIHYSCKEILRPDKVLYFTMEPEQCIERITRNRSAQSLEIFETTEKLTKIKHLFETVFQKLEGSENVICIDAAGSREEVFSAVLKAVNSR